MFYPNLGRAALKGQMAQRGTKVFVHTSLMTATQKLRNVVHIATQSSQSEDLDHHPVRVLVAAIVCNRPQCVLGESHQLRENYPQCDFGQLFPTGVLYLPLEEVIAETLRNLSL